MPPSSTETATPGVRSLADDLRARTDDELAALLLARPDLARPAPSDLTALAARSTTRSSSTRAIDNLDLTTLQVLEAAAVLADSIDTDAVHVLLGWDDAQRDVVADALDELQRRALIWGEPAALHLSRGVLDVLGPHPAGLGPESVEPTVAPSPQPTMESLADDAPVEARAVLDSLTWGPPVAVAPTPGTRAAAGADWLVAQGILTATDGALVLPRDIGLALRGGHLHRNPAPSAPELTGTDRSPALLDRVGAGSASEVLALVDDLLSTWSLTPPRALRTGGLSVRDLAAVARSLDLSPEDAGLLLELALMAGLLAQDEHEEPSWAPTADYDQWLDQPSGQRWARLARAWWTSTRDPDLIGQRRADGKATNALGSEVHDPRIRGLRQLVLTTLAEAPEGRAPTLDALVGRVRWHRPRRVPADLESRVRGILTQAARLGLVALGALTSGGRTLVMNTTDDDLAASMETHLPTPVDHIVLQADLTAVAPGPLAGSLAHFIRQVADVESRGGATVHRFSENSIRRCLDAGWTADDIISGLTEASRTALPQPLDYLIRDTARRHGQIRVSEARSCVRVDDPAALESLLATGELAPLQLRRVAPTVAISALAADVVLEFISETGAGVVRESSAGVITLAPRPTRRSRRSEVAPTVVQSFDEAAATEAVQALRAADDVGAAAARTRRGRAPLIPTGDPTTSLVLLREAAADRRLVWVGYSDAGGAVRRFLFAPDEVEHGRVHGVADGTRRTLSVHRITGVAAE